ncbi:MAG: chromosomal replication initiator DnaA [Devosiaceae bacterium]|nr:chromosomal replication initiator DnaA [Devosiaceae bacterium]
MAKILNPTLFSQYFSVDSQLLEQEGLIDPFIDVDTQLFIDPVLLEKSDYKGISVDAIQRFRDHFRKLIRLIAISKNSGDVAWRNARRFLDLSEPPENGLGYGGSGRSGASRPVDVREAIMATAKEILDLGADDPEMISIMGFLEEDVGPDTISDFTTRVIMPDLARITEEFCNKYRIPIEENDIVTDRQLPRIPNNSGAMVPMVLVPRDIVRDLPVANDWSDIEAAAYENERIRARVNAMLGTIINPTVADRKLALRSFATGSREDFDLFLQTVKENVEFYDPNADALAYYRFKSIFANGFDELESKSQFDLRKGPEEIKKLVLETLSMFQHHVEKGNLWEELWVGNKPKKERAAQLIYWAIADCFCKANNVDISPEANMGGGPIDFKFSDGYEARVLVEMKRCSGTVKHGYEKQLEIYKDASRTNCGIFVIMDYGKLGNKLKEIKRIQKARIEAGQPASEILVIDAKKKVSASKRK